MANAMVESLKTFGIRHAEKVVVGLCSILCVVLVVLAGGKKVIETTPKRVQDDAKSAQSNLSRPQAQDDIKAKLDQAGLVQPGFAHKVELAALGQQSQKKYEFKGPEFVYTEPGAGLIREKPELIAPTDLYATANRGSIQVFKLDDQGNFIAEVKKTEPKKSVRTKKSRTRRPGGMGGSSSGYPGMPGMGGGTSKELTAKQKKEQEEEAKHKSELFAGTAKDESPEAEAKADADAKYQETSLGVRVVSIVGTIDHQKLKDNYVRALKDTGAQPHYLRLDVQRQQNRDGEWSDWADVDRGPNEDIQERLCEAEEELAPESVRLEGLVDQLPFFKVGYYKGVHVAELVPKEKRTPPKPASGGGGYPGMPGMGSSSSDASSSMGAMMGSTSMPGMGSSSGQMMGMGSSSGGPMGSGSDSGMMGMGSGGMSLGGPGGGSRGPEDVNFAKSNEPRLMIRSLDFTVEPDTSYRYRLRIVVRNPNLGWDSVTPGTDTTSKELAGPWSEPTAVVSVPADVSMFAMRKAMGSKRADEVEFLVVKWNKQDGLTICKTFTGTPGQIVGSPESALVPKEDNKGVMSKNIDFTSRQVLLDAVGSDRSLTPLGMSVSRFESPVEAIMLRPDGQLVVRDQSQDSRDEQQQTMTNIYKKVIESAEKAVVKKKKKKTGGGYPGSGSMMGGGSGRR